MSSDEAVSLPLRDTSWQHAQHISSSVREQRKKGLAKAAMHSTVGGSDLRWASQGLAPRYSILHPRSPGHLGLEGRVAELAACLHIELPLPARVRERASAVLAATRAASRHERRAWWWQEHAAHKPPHISSSTAVNRCCTA